jgi:hypothetical protein
MDKYILIFLTFLTAMSCKSKTELYLERGLDILSNKKEVNFQLFKDVWVKEIGVIRDQKLEKKTLILNLKDTLGKAMFEIDDMIGVRVWIIDDNKVKRVENWDFKPLIVYRKGFKYLLKEIKIKEDQIKKMKIYSFKEINGKKIKLGDSLMLKKVNTYND